ncbi:MAG TPA: hypothetical protein ENN29_00910 [Candidatus Hydrogenedentes bacterium]|nr:hypothetical protein [Candidatus Hydrogenedentota bacterium]
MRRFAHAALAVLAALSAGGCLGKRVDLRPVSPAQEVFIPLQCQAEPPDAVTWRVLLQRGKRESVFTVLVEQHYDGELRVAGISDLGTTLFLGVAHNNGNMTVHANKTGMSDRRLSQTVLLDATIPFLIPPEHAACHMLDDGRLALVARPAPRRSHIFVYDPDGRLVEFWRLRRKRLVHSARCDVPGSWNGYAVRHYPQCYTATYRPL